MKGKCKKGGSRQKDLKTARNYVECMRLKGAISQRKLEERTVGNTELGAEGKSCKEN